MRMCEDWQEGIYLLQLNNPWFEFVQIRKVNSQPAAPSPPRSGSLWVVPTI